MGLACYRAHSWLQHYCTNVELTSSSSSVASTFGLQYPLMVIFGGHAHIRGTYSHEDNDNELFAGLIQRTWIRGMLGNRGDNRQQRG